jgi:hypothetical protein
MAEKEYEGIVFVELVKADADKLAFLKQHFNKTKTAELIRLLIRNKYNYVQRRIKETP